MSMKYEPCMAGRLRGTRTCVLFPGALGDFICFLPTLRLLAKHSEVDLFAQSQFAEIAPEGVMTQSLERTEVRKLFACGPQADEELTQFFGVYDTVYSWLGSGNKGFAATLQAVTGGRARLFPFRPTTTQKHQVEYYLGCLMADAAISSEPIIDLREDAIAWRENFWAGQGLDRQPVLVIAPGSGAREKNWPEEFFLRVVQWWRAAIGGVVILLAGPVEKERGGINRLRSHCLDAGDLRLSQVAALLSRCTVYLGNDSGVTHLAASLGTCTVAIFGPSDARQWAPRGAKVRVAQHTVVCSPCLVTTMKGCTHRACLTELQPSEVINVLEALPEVVTLTRSGSGITV
jgi:ADP-heptose:LPS heptosyltransferase